MPETPDIAPTPATAAGAAATAPKTKLLGGDKHLWGIYIALCLISIVELYSASSREVAGNAIGVYGPLVRHVSQLLGGLAIVIAVQRVHYSRFAPAIPLFVLLSVGMAVYVLFHGENVNSATRSFHFIINVQPAEFIKFSAVAGIALVMARTQSRGDHRMRNRGVIITVAMLCVFSALLVKDGLTNTLILVAIALAMMLVGGIKITQFVLVVALLGCAGMGYMKYEEHVYEKEEQLIAQGLLEKHTNRGGTHKSRLANFSDSVPLYEQPVTDENQQAMYSYMAQANGGVLGVFPGNSREASRLPLAFTDYIYAIIVEDLGLVGGIVVLILYLWLLGRSCGIASQCRRYFPALLVIGMAVMVVTQALTHMAIVTGVVPVSGQPLPLISKGGTSILITSLAFGVMLSVSRFAVESSAKRRKGRSEARAAAAPRGPEAPEQLPESIAGENPSAISR